MNPSPHMQLLSHPEDQISLEALEGGGEYIAEMFIETLKIYHKEESGVKTMGNSMQTTLKAPSMYTQ